MSIESNSDGEVSAEELEAIEREYDEGTATREVGPTAGKVLRVVALLFAIYHFLTAGFGLRYWVSRYRRTDIQNG